MTIRKALGRLYWGSRTAWERSVAGRWFGQTVHAVWLARRCLRVAIRRHAPLARGRLLDIGCGSRPYRGLFRGISRYVGVDLPAPGVRADAYADGLRLPFRDQSFDAVLCNEVLEHVRRPERLLSEAARLLRPEGVLILTTPQVWGLHHEPCDFFRYTKYGLAHLATDAGLDVVAVAPTCGLWGTTAQRIADTVVHHYAASWPPGLRRLLGCVWWPILLAAYGVDRLIGMHGDTLDNILVARKPTCQRSKTSLPADVSWSRAA